MQTAASRFKPSRWFPGIALAAALAPVLDLGATISASAATSFADIYDFGGTSSANQQNPEGALLEVSPGKFFGVARDGSNGFGFIYSLTSTGTFIILHQFSGTDGSNPYGRLIKGPDGQYYGLTVNGGNDFDASNPDTGYGVIYKIASDGTFMVLHDLTPQEGFYAEEEGAGPYQVDIEPSLTLASDGRMYGVEPSGGLHYTVKNSHGAAGTIFTIKSDGTFRVVHTFTDNDPGVDPLSPLVDTGDGKFYSITSTGELYSIDSAGTFTSVARIFSTIPGPRGTLALGLDGSLWGLCDGGPGSDIDSEVFSVSLDGSGFKEYLSDVTTPLTVGADGKFYTTQEQDHILEAISFDTSGDVTNLYQFADNIEAVPFELTQSSSNVFYSDLSINGGQRTLSEAFQLTTGVRANPAVSFITPASANKGQPDDISVTVIGSGFRRDSVAYFGRKNGQLKPGGVMSTTYVSPRKLLAILPAAYLTETGYADIYVKDSNSGIESNAVDFFIRLTYLKLSVGDITRDPSSGFISVPVTLTNTGYYAANNSYIGAATLGGVEASSGLDTNLGPVSPGSSVSTTLVFPGTAGASGGMSELATTVYDGVDTMKSERTVALP